MVSFITFNVLILAFGIPLYKYLYKNGEPEGTSRTSIAKEIFQGVKQGLQEQHEGRK